MSAKSDILARVRRAIEAREAIGHPGPFAGRHLEDPTSATDAFHRTFSAAGGEVVHVEDHAAAEAWVVEFCRGSSGVAVGTDVPPSLRERLSLEAPERSEVGVSMAVGAIGETGSLMLSSRDGRRAQLLPPTHVVLVDAARVAGTLREALLGMKSDAPSAVGLHSGPSKSADIGQILVTGVHGPGRVIAVVIGAGA